MLTTPFNSVNGRIDQGAEEVEGESIIEEIVDGMKCVYPLHTRNRNAHADDGERLMRGNGVNVEEIEGLSIYEEDEVEKREKRARSVGNDAGKPTRENGERGRYDIKRRRVAD